MSDAPPSKNSGAALTRLMKELGNRNVVVLESKTGWRKDFAWAAKTIGAEIIDIERFEYEARVPFSSSGVMTPADRFTIKRKE